MDEGINYTVLVEKALLEVVRDALRYVSQYGLPGEQHFYVTFKTQYPGVRIPIHLAERYLDEMTIVLQHQFWNVLVAEDYFSVDLSFNNRRETLVIPFGAMTAFADPSEQFGLQFTSVLPGETVDGDTDADPAIEGDAQDGDADTATEKQGEVIALDAFRKK